MPPKPVIYGWVFALIVFGATFLSEWNGGVSEQTGGFGKGASSATMADNTIRLWPQVMPLLVSVVLLGAAVWVILSQKYTPTDRHWAYGNNRWFWLHTT